MKRILAIFLTVLSLFLPSCSKGEFSYTTSDITDYFKLKLADFTGGTYDLDIPAEITDEDAFRELRRYQLRYATYDKTKGVDSHAQAPGVGDEAYIFFEVAFTPDGQNVLSNFFSEDGAHPVSVGVYEFPEFLLNSEPDPLFDNAALSEALLETLPIARITEGTVGANDVVVLDIDCVDVGANSFVFNRKGARIDTASFTNYLEEGLYPEPLLSSLIGKQVGDSFSISHTFTPEGASAEVTYTYNCKITHKVEDRSVSALRTVAIDIPANTFDTSYSEVYQSFNGNTVYMRFYTARYVDYTLPELNRQFYVEKLGLKTDETDEEKVTELALRAFKNKLERSRLVNQVYPAAMSVVLSKVLDGEKDPLKKYPAGLVEAKYDELVANVTEAYESAQKKALDEGRPFAYKNIDAFAAYYYDYNQENFASMVAYCKDEARFQIRLYLCVFAMAQVSGVRYTPEEFDDLFADYMEKEMADYLALGISLTEEELTQLHAGSNASAGDKKYAEFVWLVKKAYRDFNGTPVTEEEIYDAHGTRDEYFFAACYSMMDVLVGQYIYENNTWNDTTP